jgi:hypothetical protein
MIEQGDALIKYEILKTAFCYFFVRIRLMEKVTGGDFRPHPL